MFADPFSMPLHVPILGFTGGSLDRNDVLRRDSAQLDTLRRHPDARWLLFKDLQPIVAVAEGSPPDLLWHPASAAPHEGDWVFLGLKDNIPHFAAAVSPDTAVAGEVMEARAAATAFMDERAAVMGQGRSLLAWHSRHQFCAACGGATEVAKGGYSRQCIRPECKAEHFPRVDPVVIMLVIDGDRCLLGRQPAFPPQRYSALAGFVEPGESLEEAVRREVFEEAGIKTGRVRYIASQPWPFPSNLMIGCFAEAETRDIRIDDTELEDARWFTRSDVRAALAGDGPFIPPPRLAIARNLLETWMALGS